MARAQPANCSQQFVFMSKHYWTNITSHPSYKRSNIASNKSHSSSVCPHPAPCLPLFLQAFIHSLWGKGWQVMKLPFEMCFTMSCLPNSVLGDYDLACLRTHNNERTVFSLHPTPPLQKVPEVGIETCMTPWKNEFGGSAFEPMHMNTVANVLCSLAPECQGQKHNYSRECSVAKP